MPTSSGIERRSGHLNIMLRVYAQLAAASAPLIEASIRLAPAANCPPLIAAA